MPAPRLQSKRNTMGLPLPTPKPPPLPMFEGDDFTGIESLDRPELDDAPDTERDPRRHLPTLDWEEDSESGVVKRRA